MNPFVRLLMFLVLCVFLWGGQPRLGAGLTEPTAELPGSSTVTTVPTPSLELVGHIGGPALQVALQGFYAYVASNRELAVLDISDPAHPNRVGFGLYPSVVNHIGEMVIEDGYAYLASDQNGLQILDVSTPANPHIVFHYTNECSDSSDVAVVGNYAYVICNRSWANNDLRILDISNPASPLEKGSYNINQHFLNAAVSGGFAYVLTLNNVLHVVDISDPENPTEVAALAGTGCTYYCHFVLEGVFAYIASPTDQDEVELAIVNLADPHHPAKVGSVILSGWGSYLQRPLAVGNLVYVLTHDQHNGLHTFDVSDPAHPRLLHSVQVTGDPEDVAVVANAQEAYIATYERGLRVLDIHDPQTPVEIGAYDPPVWGEGLALSGSHIYFSGNYYVQRIVDISNPALPEVVGVYDLPGRGQSVALAGNTAYVATDSAGLRVLDVSDPTHITEIGNYPGSFYAVAAAGDYAYVSGWAERARLDILDVSNPGQPVLAGSLHVGIGGVLIDDLALRSSYLFATTSLGLQVVDVSDPASPVSVASLPVGQGELVLVENRLYLSGHFVNGDVRFLILDITNPLQPVQLGTYYYLMAGGTYLTSIAVSGSLAYIGFGGTENGEASVLALDISDPAHIVEIARYEHPAWVSNELAASTPYVYMDGWDGLSVLRLSLVLAGRVTDASYLPQADVSVAFSSGISANTNTDGLYAFDGLLPGEYTITPTLPGFAMWPPVRAITLPTHDYAAQNFIALPRPASATLTTGITTTLAYTDLQGSPTRLLFPAAAVTQTVTVTVTPTFANSEAYWTFTGHAFDLSTSPVITPSLSFNVPVTVTITYSDWDVRNVTDENGLILYWWDGSAWVDAAATCPTPSIYEREIESNRLSLGICQLGRYALWGKTENIFLPLVWVDLER